MVGHCAARGLGSRSLFGDHEIVVIKASSKGYCTVGTSREPQIPKQTKGDLGLGIPLMQTEQEKNWRYLG